MAKDLLSTVKNWGTSTVPDFDTYIPGLDDAANIQEAFQLFMYGTTTPGDYPANVDVKSLYYSLKSIKTTADTANTNSSSHISATGNVHGLAIGADVVGTTSTQDLYNKTLMAPSVTGTLTATGNVIGHIDVIEKTSGHTIVLSDDGKMILMNSASANVLTIPATGFDVGTQITVVQSGVGQTTISPASGAVTINATPGLKLRTQWAAASLVKISPNSWFVTGDLST
jgi:hypothetical protein